MKRSLIAVAAAGVIALATAGQAQAAVPGANGKLAFDSDRECQSPRCGAQRIFTMSPDGAFQSRLLPELAYDPSWSPDGARIAYTADPNSFQAGPYIAVVNADGTGRTQVTPSFSLSSDSQPSWSPDGRKIAFTRFVRGADGFGAFEIFVIDADGSNPTRLTDSHAGGALHAAEPAWSPDGSRIAFTRLVPDALDHNNTDSEIYVMNADGTGLVDVSNHPSAHGNTTPNDIEAAWSPDGSRIAFTSFRDGNYDVYTIAPDGAGLNRVTTYSTPDFWPAWSPDGTRIAFSRAPVGFPNMGFQIFTTGSDGTGEIRLTGSGDSNNFRADWQAVNRPPDCSGVTATPDSLSPPNRKFRTVTLDGASDPDGNPVSLSIDRVTQDERVGARPDAIRTTKPSQVKLRAERRPRGDGRVYRIAFTATDDKGGKCSGVTTVEVRRHRKRPAVDSAPPSYDSFVPDRAEDSQQG